MKRSGFKRKPSVWLSRRRRTLRQQGRKSREWARVRAELKREFERKGIILCELEYAGCLIDECGFAHAHKRRNLGTGDERERRIRTVILACHRCHRIIEELGEQKMSEIVLQTIAMRREAA